MKNGTMTSIFFGSPLRFGTQARGAARVSSNTAALRVVSGDLEMDPELDDLLGS